MHIRKASLKPLVFDGMKIFDYTPSSRLSSSFAIIEVPAGVSHAKAWSRRSDKYYFIAQGEIEFVLAHISQMTLITACNEVTLSPMNTGANEPQTAEIRRMQFKYIFNSPQMHIWHHTHAEAGPGDRNFALTLSIWDWLFRTAYLPDHDPDRLGFRGMESFPRSLWRQLLIPLSFRSTSSRPHER